MNYKENEIDSFKMDLLKFNIVLDDKKMDSFLKYYELLIEWNSFMNLTSITDFSEVLKKHFIDSISLVNAVPYLLKDSYQIIDVGSGAGFPGIPLKIIFPQLKVTLIDSLNKRIKFLNEVSNSLGGENMTIIHGRAEDLARPGKLREKYDFCISRAVSNLATLSEYCIPFVRKNGFFISYKSEQISEEYENAKNVIHILGGKLENQIHFFLPNSDIGRNLIVIKKIKPTPLKYPRKAGIPSKEPIVK